MKIYGRVDVQTQRFLDIGTSWRRVVSFALRSLYPRETATGTHWIGGCAGHRAGLDYMEKRKFFTLTGARYQTSLSPSL
jgi:hypothetical protein